MIADADRSRRDMGNIVCKKHCAINVAMFHARRRACLGNFVMEAVHACPSWQNLPRFGVSNEIVHV